MDSRAGPGRPRPIADRFKSRADFVHTRGARRCAACGCGHPPSRCARHAGWTGTLEAGLTSRLRGCDAPPLRHWAQYLGAGRGARARSSSSSTRIDELGTISPRGPTPRPTRGVPAPVSPKEAVVHLDCCQHSWRAVVGRRQFSLGSARFGCGRLGSPRQDPPRRAARLTTSNALCGVAYPAGKISTSSALRQGLQMHE